MKTRLLVLSVFLWVFCSIVSAQAASYSRNGDEITSVSGQYATAAHCGDAEICSWISGSQIILGAYNSNPSTWSGVEATWSFAVDVPPGEITSATLKFEWPTSFGKGLHSLVDGSSAIVRVGSETIATPTVTSSYRCPSDYYAFPCGTASTEFDVPPGLIGAATPVTVSVPGQSLWDLGKLTLTVNCGQTWGRIKIIDEKIQIDGKPFLVKGVDYAPWITGTGPDPTQQRPFPAKASADVSEQLTRNGRRWVRDYSRDGKIQAREVIRYDIATMKTLGINTIRLYAAAPWHDRNLNGVLDHSTDPRREEIDQGDLPGWAVKYILDLAHQNGMMVILGYWVQEENFEQAPPVCDGNDLLVAKQTLKRMINRYKKHPAVLAWDIGNEVNGDWNHSWFSWGMAPNDYLNALFAHAKSLDSAHPTMYAKYVGEPAGFDELHADIIAVNAFTNPASMLAGEFSLPAPCGKAYLLGEFGHTLSQARGHWRLAKQHAGGCFLEFNNVWWKGDGQNLLGVVNPYRAQNSSRFKKLKTLYAEGS